jgi:glyoxylase-like metal-dependent hydrolase (beta-lactamase superfamily II)
MTLDGTNSYLIDAGDGTAFCIDPGPAMAGHIDALLGAAREMKVRIASICVTHGHPDHAPGARLLHEATGAPVAAHANATFAHDRDVSDGESLHLGDAALIAMDAPGHSFDHLVFYEPREAALFTGDVVLGEGTVLIAPPGGAMRPYQRTLQRLLDEFPAALAIYGGHGPIVRDPRTKLHEYLTHRQRRERELLAELAERAQSIPELVARIYRETAPQLWPAAGRQILAHLIALEREGRVRSQAVDARDADESRIYRLSDPN